MQIRTYIVIISHPNSITLRNKNCLNVDILSSADVMISSRGATGILLALVVVAADAASLHPNFPNQRGRVRRSLPEDGEAQPWFSFSGTHVAGMMDSTLFFAKDHGMAKDHR